MNGIRELESLADLVVLSDWSKPFAKYNRYLMNPEILQAYTNYDTYKNYNDNGNPLGTITGSNWWSTFKYPGMKLDFYAYERFVIKNEVDLENFKRTHPSEATKELLATRVVFKNYEGELDLRGYDLSLAVFSHMDMNNVKYDVKPYGFYLTFFDETTGMTEFINHISEEVVNISLQDANLKDGYSKIIQNAVFYKIDCELDFSKIYTNGVKFIKSDLSNATFNSDVNHSINKTLFLNCTGLDVLNNFIKIGEEPIINN